MRKGCMSLIAEPLVGGKRLTTWKLTVSKKQVNGTTSGSTAKEVSPTSPRVTLLIASRSTSRPRYGATMTVSYARICSKISYSRSEVDQ
jgi:hypothetical protein